MAKVLSGDFAIWALAAPESGEETFPPSSQICNLCGTIHPSIQAYRAVLLGILLTRNTTINQ